MKIFLSILCSIALIFCFTLPTFAIDETGDDSCEYCTERLHGNSYCGNCKSNQPAKDSKGLVKAEATTEEQPEAAASQSWLSGLTKTITTFVNPFQTNQAAQNAPPANEGKKEAPKAAVKKETPQPAQSKFNRTIQRQYYITLGLAAAAGGLNYYCSGGGCYGSQLAQGVAGAAPALVGYLALSTGIAYFL